MENISAMKTILLIIWPQKCLAGRCWLGPFLTACVCQGRYHYVIGGCLPEPHYCLCKIGGPLFLLPQSPLSISAQNWLQVWGSLLSGVRGAVLLNFRWILPRKVALSTWALSLI